MSSTPNNTLTSYLHNTKCDVINYACSKWYDILHSNNMDYGSLSAIYNNDLWIQYKQKNFYTHFKHLIVWYDDGNDIDTYISPNIPNELFVDLLNWNKKTIQRQTGKDLFVVESQLNSIILHLTTISTILDSISWNQFNLYLDQHYNTNILK